MPTRVKLQYLSAASRDVEEIVKYHITQVGVASARNVYQCMEQTVNKLADYPLLGQIHPDLILAAQGYRKLVLDRTYVTVYKLIGDTVYIYRIVNGTTDYPRLLK